MMNLARQKEKARAHELNEQWREALEMYVRLVEESTPEELDISLFNRIGDLHLRVGQADAAVGAYERAVEAYVEAGLYNNAIALCNKILRTEPGRTEVYLRLGQISAEQGFLADARTNFLRYAERLSRAGRGEEAFDALKEFAALSPHDVEIRLVLAEQLRSHERTDEALEQLRLVLGALGAAGRMELETEVREQILALDPDADLAAPLPSSTDEVGDDDEGAGDEAGSFVLLPTMELGATPVAEPIAAPALIEILPTAHADEPAVGEMALMEISLVEGLEPTQAAAPKPPLLELSLEAEAGDEDAPEVEPLPFIGGELAMLDPAAVALLEPDAEESVEEDPDEDTAAELLPFISAAPEWGEVELAITPSAGAEPEPAELLDAAHHRHAAAGRYADAWDALDQLIELRPAEAALYQTRAEYAFHAGDTERLIRSYLALARQLEGGADAAKAAVVYEQVLELDPTNTAARLGTGRGAPAAPPAVKEDYVDLAALILDVDELEPTTRFVVAEDEPTGDEDRDFAEMLSRFRQKVTENIATDDSASHYDLGLAFKDMGLLDEAIAQFQVALRGGANPLATLEVLGECFVEKEQYALAARVLERALRVSTTAEAELIGVFYLLARAEEVLGNLDRAGEYYERVLSLDIRFRDVQARLVALRDAARSPSL